MPDEKTNTNMINDFEDRFCLLKAERALEEFVQVKIISDLVKEETDPGQKELLTDLLKEEKEEFLKSKAELDECMFVNGSQFNQEVK